MLASPLPAFPAEGVRHKAAPQHRAPCLVLVSPPVDLGRKIQERGTGTGHWLSPHSLGIRRSCVCCWTYDPVGCHSHSTPLHQAALAGDSDVVRLLVERGVRLDLKDAVWQGTPAEWAGHEGRDEIEKFLRSWEQEGESAAGPTRKRRPSAGGSAS